MMMIALNSLFRQKKGAQWEEEDEKAGDRRKGSREKEAALGIATPSADALTGPSRSGELDDDAM